MDVWYAAYGSNMSRERFDCYIRGGRPPGGARTYSGCRDPSPPRDERTTEIAGELVFGGTSRTWGGGVAFLDADSSESPTKACLYRIALDQFEDVVAQENWLDPGAIRLEIPLSPRVVLEDELSYGLVLVLGELEGIPLVTLTKSRRAAPAPPSPPYVRHVAKGLAEAFSMTTDGIVGYLLEKPGIREGLSRDELARALED